MTINKLNYEVYAIDYLDGNLSGDLKEEMEQFLLLNPEIAREVDVFNSMVLVADSSIEYFGKGDMKKPMQFAILNYMNWIVPICMSIAFMVVYPYIREYRGADIDLKPTHQPVKEMPSSKSEKNTVELDKTTPVSSAATVKNSPNTSFSVPTFVRKSNNRANNVMAVQQQKNNNLAPLENMQQAENTEYWDEEEKSTVDFLGERVSSFEKQDLELDNQIEMYPNELTVSNKLKKGYIAYALKPLGKPTPYLSLSITPFGLGYDVAKTTNIETQQLIRDLPIDDNSDLVLNAPVHIGLGLALNLSESVAIETGYYATKRNLTYVPFSNLGNANNKIKTDIQYITHSIPANVLLTLPFLKRNHHLNARIGMAMNWMGSRDFDANMDGSFSDETARTAIIVKTPATKLITTDGELKFTPSMQFGIEYDRDLIYGNIAFALIYNRQMNNISQINVWDYNELRDVRIGESETFNMRYETITASIKYTLPQKWYLGGVKK
jgi:hypothetical protein